MVNKIIRIIQIIVIGTILTIGGCISFLWHNYQSTAYNPCQTHGERRGITDIAELAPAGSNYPAICSGKLNNQWVNFRAG